MPKTEPFNKFTDEYESWFKSNPLAFKSELNAIKKALPGKGKTIEVGIGTGIFAKALGIGKGIDPSEAMRKKAMEKGIKAGYGIAEDLPYNDKSIANLLMITTLCFVDDIRKSFEEVQRVLWDHGCFIIGYIDRDGPVGQYYEENRKDSLFFRDAKFYTWNEISGLLRETGFSVEKTYQTLFGKANGINKLHEVITGHGQGSFVVIKALKQPDH